MSPQTLQALIELIPLMQKPNYSLDIGFTYQGVPVKVQLKLLELGGMTPENTWE